ncbi:TonB-dependent receptor [Sphingomonas jatrophae]|uniref:Outer membrane receptor proteins, mostly Fe transport n=1 Tax=Sphingomonas jatrophae TaxID=1166337 RepID=A0A1I6M1K0_9SPHN|nr:TonB-dependent receptor [Sphingomonas jatrophae]SFS09596.1 Outer membrane receptor proteins, mostly Fe transport [Sphingomonas jatrophae]
MLSNRRLRVAHLLTGGALLVTAGVAQAQSTDAATPPAAQAAPPAPETAAVAAEQDGGGLQDIIVTARKRLESVQDVPVSVTAISAATVRQQDLTSLEKIAARTPNFSVGRASNGSGAQLTMRGIGSSSTSIGIEQSVATVVDGVYYGQGRIINEGFFDLARIEILKGPQALFFGKNATAGVISLTTADPTDQFEVLATGRYEIKSEQVQAELIGSGPLTDTLGVRVAVRGSKMFGGYYRNEAVPFNFVTTDIATGRQTTHVAEPSPREAPGEKELLGRITLKWEPTSDITNTLKASGSYNKVNNNSWNYVAFNCPTGRSQLTGYQCGDEFVTHQNKIPASIAASFPFAKEDGSLYNRYKSWAVTNNLVWQLEGVTLTNVTNYNWNNNRWACACDFQSGPASNWATENSTFHAFSNELRAQTNFDGPINLLAGALYQKTKRKFSQFIILGNVEDSRQSAANRYVGTSKTSFTDGETIAGFGQVVWKVVPTMEVAGGVRYTHETKDSFFTQPYNNAALTAIFRPSNSADGLGIINADQTFDDWSPEATISWKPNGDILVYGAYKTNYKSGGFSNGGINSAFSPNPFDDLTFGPEKARGFEAGIKTTLLDNQLRFNVGAYTYKYSNLQVDFFNSPIFAFQTLTADARTKGVEVDFEYAPRALDGFNLHGSINYNRARYTSFPVAPCYAGQTPAEGCNLALAATGNFTRQDLGGAALSVAPEWTGTLGASYDTIVGDGFKIGGSVDARYSDSYIASAFDQPDSRQGSYVNLDASIRFGAEDDRWQLAVIGKNLTNRFYVTGVVDGPSTGGGTGTPAGLHADQLGFGTLPRTVMVQVSTRF